MTDLTTEEYSLLVIHAEGGNVADIGIHSKWHEPINSLIAKGLLRRHDQFNHSITPQGEMALKRRQAEERAEMRHAFAVESQIDEVQARIHVHIRAAVVELLEAVSISSGTTGKPADHELRQWGKVLLEEAQRMMREQAAAEPKRLVQQ